MLYVPARGVCRIRKPAYAGNGRAIFSISGTAEVGQKRRLRPADAIERCCPNYQSQNRRSRTYRARSIVVKKPAAAQARDGELDGLFERIYEDNISGRLSDERFAKMSQRYEEEQTGLAEKIKALRKELDKLSGDAVSTDMFLATVRKYTRAKKLTPRMLNELVNHIEVHQAEKINGEWVQKLTIHCNCVGALFIPDTPSMPVPDVTVNTRKGVYVSYEPAQNEQ